ncbi:MAG TPA: hydrolase [Steroidobacteraceae bacterium]|jgi:nicotinamidase-related amidase
MHLEAKTSALVLIDLQKMVMAATLAPHSAAAVYERSMRLAAAFRTAGALVVRVRVSFSPDFLDALRLPVDRPSNHSAWPAGWDEFPEPPPASDLVITKRQWGAFHGTELDLQLSRRGINRIVLGGIATNMGVESTARAAAEHGYELVIAEDLCSSMSAEMHSFSFEHILPRLARITSAEAITLA